MFRRYNFSKILKLKLHKTYKWSKRRLKFYLKEIPINFIVNSIVDNEKNLEFSGYFYPKKTFCTKVKLLNFVDFWSIFYIYYNDVTPLCTFKCDWHNSYRERMRVTFFSMQRRRCTMKRCDTREICIKMLLILCAHICS